MCHLPFHSSRLYGYSFDYSPLLYASLLQRSTGGGDLSWVSQVTCSDAHSVRYASASRPGKSRSTRSFPLLRRLLCRLLGFPVPLAVSIFGLVLASHCQLADFVAQARCSEFSLLVHSFLLTIIVFSFSYWSFRVGARCCQFMLLTLRKTCICRNDIRSTCIELAAGGVGLSCSYGLQGSRQQLVSGVATLARGC